MVYLFEANSDKEAVFQIIRQLLSLGLSLSQTRKNSNSKLGWPLPSILLFREHLIVDCDVGSNVDTAEEVYYLVATLMKWWMIFSKATHSSSSLNGFRSTDRNEWVLTPRQVASAAAIAPFVRVARERNARRCIAALNSRCWIVHSA